MAADSQRGRERRELEERVSAQLSINKECECEIDSSIGECTESIAGAEDGGGEQSIQARKTRTNQVAA